MIKFSLCKACKYDGDKTITDNKFGYNWFYFFPRLNWNGGYWKNVVTDLSVSWFCYNFGVLIWWKHKKEENNIN